MKFIYSHARLPENPKLLQDIDSAAQRLFKKVHRIDIDSLDVSDYTKHYLRNLLGKIQNMLQKYSYVLSWSAASSISREEFTLVEYGGGSGLLSLLAKELSIGTVIYNDIYPISCRDAKTIGDAMENQADHYVQGDIDDVITFLETHSLSCDAVASYDVIEHVYDIEGFFRRIPALSDGSLTVVMSSGANGLNPLIKKHIMKKHREVEYKDQEKKWGHKERDCLRAYFKVRKEIILAYETLTEKEGEQLARATRGMLKPDIEKCVDVYVQTGYIPQELAHPTNTCDPLTGNWAEHLMDPYCLRDILLQAGFKAEVLNGYHGHYKNSAKTLLGKMLNVAISLTGRQGIRMAPFFTIYGRRE
ncbi:MAG: methyltransferase domain-containing protein [Theionarchaea archaeon]|nr:methyltransferase domain-containing protein [Theionarchaea archaeon]